MTNKWSTHERNDTVVLGRKDRGNLTPTDPVYDGKSTNLPAIWHT